MPILYRKHGYRCRAEPDRVCREAGHRKPDENLYQNIEQNGDKAQLYYYNLLKSLMYGTFYCGTLDNVEKSKETEKNFLIKTKVYFKDSDWIPMIEKQIEDSEK